MLGRQNLAPDLAAGMGGGMDVEVHQPGPELGDLVRRDREGLRRDAPATADGTPVNGNRIGAATPGPSGPWMWEIVAGVVKPVQLSFTVMVVWSAPRVTEPKPVAADPVGGVSCVPVRWARNTSGPAKAAALADPAAFVDLAAFVDPPRRLRAGRRSAGPRRQGPSGATSEVCILGDPRLDCDDRMLGTPMSIRRPIFPESSGNQSVEQARSVD